MDYHWRLAASGALCLLLFIFVSSMAPSPYRRDRRDENQGMEEVARKFEIVERTLLAAFAMFMLAAIWCWS